MLSTIVSTYSEDEEYEIAYLVVGIPALGLFVFDYLMNFSLALDKLEYLGSWLALNNALAIVSVALLLVPGNQIFIVICR